MVRQKHVPVARYDCKSLKLLERCKLVADFAYVGTALRDKIVRIEDADQAAAQLPLSSASLRASIASGRKVDLALAEVGSKSASFELVVRTALKGDRPQDCEGATHFVHKVDVGAFAISQSATGEVTTAAQVFTASASGESRSGKSSSRSEGKLESCRKASESDTSAPDNCGVPLRAHLRRIEESGAGKAGAAQATATGGAPVIAAPCPGAMVRSEGGVCVVPSSTVRHVCQGDDLEACAQQCGAGNRESCVKQAQFSLYGLASRGVKVALDPAKARALLEKTCASGTTEPLGCSELALAFRQIEGQESAHARDALTLGCKAGDRISCAILGTDYLWAHRQGPPAKASTVDVERGIYFLERGCKLGEAGACASAGLELVRGLDYEGRELLRSDPQRGLGHLQRGCELGDQTTACPSFAHYLLEGTLVPRDAKRAGEVFGGMCARGNEDACVELALLQLEGDGVARDPATARATLESGCLEKRRPLACYGFAVLMQKGEGGVKQDLPRAYDYFAEYPHVRDAAQRALAILPSVAGAKKDPERVAALEARACMSLTNRDAALCRRSGAYLEKAKRPAEAVAVYRHACELDPKDKGSCTKARTSHKKR